MGLDVGKEQDPAALAVLRSTGRLRPDSPRPVWDVVEVGNIPLGTAYQQLADATVELADDFVRAGYPVMLTIDATGVGAPVVEMARRRARELCEQHTPAGAAEPAAEVHVVAVSICGGQAARLTGADEYTVGKHTLTEVLQVALEQQGLVLPRDSGGTLTAGAAAFVRQAEKFGRKRDPRTGYERHEAAGGGHDDLVLATELALWTGDTLHDQQAGVAP